MATIQTTVGEIVAQIPSAARIFANHQIDFCCGGKRPLEEVCRERRMDAETILQEIEALGKRNPRNDRNWSAAPLAELTSYIVRKHHGYLRTELPWLEKIVRKVSGKHSETHAFLPELQDIQVALRGELESHLAKEESILFPFINTLEAAAGGCGTVPHACFGAIGNPIRMMELEHETVGTALRRMSALTSDYALPPGACTSFRILYHGLRALDEDLRVHIHLENNVLHPRAIELEKKVTEQMQSVR